jgi:glycosyltransferase involved in cell wall biosynthesis
VRLAGGRVDTASYFGAADAFALTSREDPFPMVNLEAMARGVPVVAFVDAGGAVEVLTQRAGIVVPYLDVKAMAREIVALCEAPHYHAEIADAARRRIATHHRWRDYVDRLVSIFESDFGYRS